MNFLKQMKPKNIIISSIVLVTLLLLLQFLTSQFPITSQYTIDDQWYYQVDLNDPPQPLTEVRSVDVPLNTPVYFTRTIDPQDQLTLSFNAYHQFVEVYLEESLIFTNHTSHEPYGFNSYNIELPETTTPQSLKIVIRSYDGFYNGYLDTIRLADQASLTKENFINSLVDVATMYSTLLISFPFLCFALSQPLDKRTKRTGISLSIFAILWSIYYLSITPLTTYLFSPLTRSFMNYGLSYILPIPMLLFLFFTLKKHHKVVGLLALCYTLFAMYPLTGILGDINRYYNLYALFSFIQYAFYGIGLILLWVEYLYGEKQHKPTLILFLYLAIAIIVNDIFYFSSTLHLQSLGMNTAMIILVVYHYYIIFTDYLRQVARAENMNKIAKIKNKLTLSSYQTTQNHLHEISLIRHEFKHYLLTLKLLIEEHSPQELDQYVRELSSFHFIQKQNQINPYELTLQSIINDHQNESTKITLTSNISNNYHHLEFLQILYFLCDVFTSTPHSNTIEIHAHLQDDFSQLHLRFYEDSFLDFEALCTTLSELFPHLTTTSRKLENRQYLDIIKKNTALTLFE